MLRIIMMRMKSCASFLRAADPEVGFHMDAIDAAHLKQLSC
jgi:hypothetical protein